MMTNRPGIYIGVGARNTPMPVLRRMTELAQLLGAMKWGLRTGAARGADTAFEIGAKDARAARRIYVPWEGFRNRFTREGTVRVIPAEGEHFHLARLHHPAWNRLTMEGKKLMARNTCVVYGLDLINPADVLVCWTPNAEIVGGTGQSIRLAQARAIPVINLAAPEIRALDAGALAHKIDRDHHRRR